MKLAPGFELQGSKAPMKPSAAEEGVHKRSLVTKSKNLKKKWGKGIVSFTCGEPHDCRRGRSVQVQGVGLPQPLEVEM